MKGCKEEWIKDQCSKVEKAHQAAESKKTYSTIKKITKKSKMNMQTIKNKQGQILTELHEVKDRWKENYS